MPFPKNYDNEPIVLIAAGHNSEGNNLKPIYMSVTPWIEVFSNYLTNTQHNFFKISNIKLTGLIGNAQMS